MTSRFDALFELGRYDAALDAALQDRSRDPESYPAACQVAQALVGLQRWPEALAAANDAVALEPEDELGHRLRSIALRSLGRHDEAVAAAEEAVRLDDDVAQGWQVLLQAYLLAGRPDDTMRAAHVLVTTFPDRADSHAMMGLVALNRQQWGLAEQACRYALSIDPEHPTALHNLGVALDAQNRHGEAVAMMTAAARSDPDDQLTQDTLRSVALGHALRGAAAIAVVLVFAVVAIAPDPEGESGALGGTMVYGAMALGYALYRGFGAYRVQRMPPAARYAVAPVLRRRDKIAWRLLLFAFVVYVSVGIEENDWAATAVSALFAAAALVWSFDGRLRLPRFGDAVDAVVGRVTGRGRSAPPYP